MDWPHSLRACADWHPRELEHRTWNRSCAERPILNCCPQAHRVVRRDDACRLQFVDLSSIGSGLRGRRAVAEVMMTMTAAWSINTTVVFDHQGFGAEVMVELVWQWNASVCVHFFSSRIHKPTTAGLGRYLINCSSVNRPYLDPSQPVTNLITSVAKK